MRKITLRFIFLLAGILTLGAAVLQAAPDRAGRNSHAFYYPEDTLFYGEVLISDDHFDQIDQIYRNIITTAPNFMGPSSLRSILEESIGPGLAGQTVGDVYAALGDYASVGVQLDFGTEELMAKFVVDITDREQIESLIDGDSWDSVEEVDGDTVYSMPGTTIILQDDKLVILGGDMLDTSVTPEGRSLLDNESWAQAWAAMPESSYNLTMFMDLPALLESEGVRDTLDEEPLTAELFDSIGAMLFGVTIIDDYTLVFDAAQIPGKAPLALQMAAVDPEFVRFIPANMSGFVQYSDLTSTFNQTFELLDRVYAMYQSELDMPTTNPDVPFSDIMRAGVRITGFDLDEDILSWTTGDYAFFGRADILPIIDMFSENLGGFPSTDQQQEAIEHLDFGGIMEIGDLESAHAFYEEVSARVAALNTLAEAAERSHNVDVEQITINGADATHIHLVDYNGEDDQLEVDLAFGVNDEVFVFGTLNVVEAVLNGDVGLDTNDVYQRSSEYILPNAHTVFYGDSDVLTTFLSSFFTALAGPTVTTYYADPGMEMITPYPTASYAEPTATPFVPTLVPTVPMESTAEVATDVPTLTDAPPTDEVATGVPTLTDVAPTDEAATGVPTLTEVPGETEVPIQTVEPTEEAFTGGMALISNSYQSNDPMKDAIDDVVALIHHIANVTDFSVSSQAVMEDGTSVSRFVLKLNPQ